MSNTAILRQDLSVQFHAGFFLVIARIFVCQSMPLGERMSLIILTIKEKGKMKIQTNT